MKCAGCQKEGEWTKRCSRCKQVHYCGGECQKAHWLEHKKVCLTPPSSSAPPSEAPARATTALSTVPAKAGEPSPAVALASGTVFLLTEGLLRVSYLEGCGEAGGLTHVKRRMEKFGPITEAWVGSKAAGTLQRLRDVDAGSLMRAVAVPYMQRSAEMNPNCSLQFEATGLKMAAPLSDEVPWLPRLKLDACVPAAFVAFSTKGSLAEFFKTLKQDDKALDGLVDPSSPISAMGGFDDETGEPRPMAEFQGGIMVTFSGLAAARRKRPALYACFLGGAKNNFIAGACAKKALLYLLGEGARYVSPTATNETVVNARGAVHTARMFATVDLRDLARYSERRCVDEFKCKGRVAYPTQLTAPGAAV